MFKLIAPKISAFDLWKCFQPFLNIIKGLLSLAKAIALHWTCWEFLRYIDFSTEGILCTAMSVSWKYSSPALNRRNIMQGQGKKKSWGVHEISLFVKSCQWCKARRYASSKPWLTCKLTLIVSAFYVKYLHSKNPFILLSIDVKSSQDCRMSSRQKRSFTQISLHNLKHCSRKKEMRKHF